MKTKCKHFKTVESSGVYGKTLKDREGGISRSGLGPLVILWVLDVSWYQAYHGNSQSYKVNGIKTSL